MSDITQLADNFTVTELLNLMSERERESVYRKAAKLMGWKEEESDPEAVTCFECDEPVIPDPDGSPGVMVHEDRNIDSQHVCIPWQDDEACDPSWWEVSIPNPYAPGEFVEREAFDTIEKALQCASQWGADEDGWVRIINEVPA